MTHNVPVNDAWRLAGFPCEACGSSLTLDHDCPNLRHRIRMTFTALAGLDRPEKGTVIRVGDALLRVVQAEPLRDDEGREVDGFTLEVVPLVPGKLAPREWPRDPETSP